MTIFNKVYKIFLATLFCASLLAPRVYAQEINNQSENLSLNFSQGKELALRSKEVNIVGNVFPQNIPILTTMIYRENFFADSFRNFIGGKIDYFPYSQNPELRRTFSTGFIFGNKGLSAKLQTDFTRSEMYKENKSIVGIYRTLNLGREKFSFGAEIFNSDYLENSPSVLGTGFSLGYFRKSLQTNTGISVSTDRKNYSINGTWGLRFD